MKKLITIITATLLLILLGCEEDDYVPPFGDFSSLEWVITEGDQGDTDYIIAVNSYIGFFDVSRNAVSHDWGIPSGTRILSTEFTEQDTDLTPFIVDSGPLTSGENLVNILFVESGVKEVVLNNVFEQEVEGAEEVNGQWVVRQVFTVTVLDDIRPAFKVFQDGEEVLNVTENDLPDEAQSASWPTIEVEAGKSLTYVDMTTVGSPDSRNWSFRSGAPNNSQEESVEVFYNSLGNFRAGSVKVVRNAEDKPRADTTKQIPLNIEVVPSSAPFVLSSTLVESETEVISFQVSGEVTSVAGEEGNFTVNVVNAQSGFDQNIPVQSVSIDPTDPTTLQLVLNQPIYNSDVITVTYTAGNITSADFRTLNSFGPQVVEMFFGGVMDIENFTGYELEWNGNGNQFRNANTTGWSARLNARNEDGPLYFLRDDSFAFDGNSSMKLETPATGIPDKLQLRGGGLMEFNGRVAEGTYIPSVWIYIDPATEMTTIEYNFNRAEGISFVFDISATPKGEWVQLRLPSVELPAVEVPDDKSRLDVNVPMDGQDQAIVQKLWLDNFDLLLIEDRP